MTQLVRNQRGQNLLELMALFAVLGLALAIAIPWYIAHQRHQKIEQLGRQLEEERNKREKASQQKISELETEIDSTRKILGLKPKTRGQESEESTGNTTAWWAFASALLLGAGLFAHKWQSNNHKLRLEQLRVEEAKARMREEERARQELRAEMAEEDQQYARHAPKGNWRKKRNKGKGKDTPSG